MSEENVEVVRRVYDAAARHDAEAVLALYDREVEWDVSRAHPIPRMVGGDDLFRGHEEMRRFFRERHEAFGEIEDICEELIDAGDQVISVGTLRGRGRASGLEVEQTLFAVWTVEQDKIVRVIFFPTRADALEAAGLRA